MNKYILCLIVTALPACSSITSETYTEKRTLKYQKGTHPHIKDMYLHNRNNGEVSSHGVNPVNNNNVMVAPAIPVEPVSTQDDWRYVNPDLPEKQAKTYEDIQNENKLLLAQYYNNWLRE
jgi:hypothetical protein